MKKVGRYVILSELGRGAMGVVYRASDPTIDREVALKVLSLSQGQEEGTNSPQEMFMREVRAAGRLAHPSIVTIYDAFDDPVTQCSCIVMELVPGVTLEKILESGKPPSVDQTLNLIRQVAEALDYAHRNKVIHRDLKPANILVTEEGRAKITDFGIAKVLARESVARTIGIMGTPSYMSPEQVRGGDIDARTDVFSLGIMMFTMLTGQKPFTGNTAAVMFKIVYEDPALPSTVNTKLIPAHDYVVRKCLAKDRNDRYSSVRDLLNDLDDVQNGRSPRSEAMQPAAAPSVAPVVEEPTLQMPAGAGGVPPQGPAKPQAPRMPPPPTPLHMEPPAPDPTVSMPKSEPTRPSPSAPLPRPVPPPQAPPPVPPAVPLGGKTLVMQVPDLAGVSSSSSTTHPSPAGKTPPTPPGAPLMGYTLPMRVPDLSALSAEQPSTPATPPPSAPVVAPAPPPAPPPVGRTMATPSAPLPKPIAPLPPPAPVRPAAPPRDLSVPSGPATPAPPRPAPPRVAPTQLDMPAPSPVGESEPTIQFGDATETPAAPSKSKLIPILAAVGALFLIMVAAGLGYWKFRKSAVTKPAEVAVQPSPAVPPPVEPLPENPTPIVVAPVPPTPPVKPAPAPARKPLVRKTRQPVARPEPAPPPQPEPAVVAPPNPAPVVPTPAEVAKAEAAKLANTPRIITVVCNFTLKEAKFTFAGGGKVLYVGTEKGKKKKSGFLGLKGSYEGTFTHTLTVPAGVAMVSVHMESKDGSTDLTNTIKLPTAGGFVPSLSVEADNDHLNLNWKGPAGAL